MKRYLFKFDVWALLLFVLIMVPNVVWSLVPAPNDVLRVDSITPVWDRIALVLQILMVATLMFVRSSSAPQKMPLGWGIAACGCVGIYKIMWMLYYGGNVQSGILLSMTIVPCLAFIFFAAGRRNLWAGILGVLFLVCHLIFALENFILR